ncbi:MAG TPA: DUF6232 family protein [Candidatus Cybelea sp.]
MSINPEGGERTIYLDAAAKITPVRAIIAGVTYPIAAITSVRMAVIPRSMLGWLLALLGGVIAIFNVTSTGHLSGFGGGVLVLGILLVLMNPKRYIVMITTAGGEKAALRSPNAQPIVAIVDAINEAIVARG